MLSARGFAVVLVLLLAACGSDDDSTGTDDTGATSTTQGVAADDPGTTAGTVDEVGGQQQDGADGAAASDDDAPTDDDDTHEDAAAADHVVEITYADGAVVGGPATIETATGESVLLIVTSDVDEELHVHGADVYGALTAGAATEISFTADIPGQFEIELEDRGQLLATLITT